MANPQTTNSDANAFASHGIEKADVVAVNAAHQRAFFKAREKIHPKRVNGDFRRIKWLVMALTLSVYYITPWLRWDRGVGAPNQAVLIDFTHSRFYFFFIELWPQEVYYITGLLVLAAIALFLFTALAGRVWCGYACPQTVWTDLFLVVERAVEGNRNERIKLDRAPLSFDKIRKRVLKHTLWILIGLGTGGAWVFYFADAPTLARDIFQLNAPSQAYIFIGLFTFTTYLLGGFAREQVCTYMCPWPRIQSAMIDEETLAVTYRFDRGEKRGPHKKGEPWEGRGDCIDCKQCVAACPMGIDIRDGLQLECIQCALCIDACNDIMLKVSRPTGLIGYDNDLNIARRQRGEAVKLRFIRVRTVAYAIILAIVSALMLYVLLNRRDLEVNVIHDRNPMYVALTDGGLRNAYTIKIMNKARLGRSFVISAEGLQQALISAVGGIETDDGKVRIAVDGDALRDVRVLVTAAPGTVSAESTPIRFKVAPTASGDEVVINSIFIGPKS